MKEWLENEWINLASKYIDDPLEVKKLWSEIEKQYSLKIRHYHNLSHIHNMLLQTESIKDSIVNYDAFCFAVWYHDIIYKPTKKDNEEKSAVLAKKRLKSFNFDEKKIKIAQKLINSTKTHDVILTENEDNAHLLDIDLSILGTNWENYQNYTQQIRKEYAIYPNFMYRKGRKKVLEHFLKRDNLFFTDRYRSLYEVQAKENLKREIELL